MSYDRVFLKAFIVMILPNYYWLRSTYGLLRQTSAQLTQLSDNSLMARMLFNTKATYSAVCSNECVNEVTCLYRTFQADSQSCTLYTAGPISYDIRGLQGYKIDFSTNARKVVCDMASCLNNGTCTLIGNGSSLMCNCLPLFTGQYCETEIDPCNSYTVSNTIWRNIDYLMDNSDIKCDNQLKTGWYRLQFNGGDKKMPNNCPLQANICGTRYPAWFNGTLPSSGQITQGTACVLASNNCCHPAYSIQGIMAKNCGAYTTFYLKPTTACDVAYCISGTSAICTNYQVLNETWRSTVYNAAVGGGDDSNLQIGWYRIILNGLNAQIPTQISSCSSSTLKCGASVSNWYQGNNGFIPAVGFQGSGTGCGINIGLCCDMNYSPSANIKNCGSFFVYLLLAPPPGSAYCAVVDCGTPPAKPHTNVTVSTTYYNSTADYQCSAGYWYQANVYTQTSICQSNGNWSAINSCVAI